MDNNPPSVFRTALKYAVMLGIASVLYSLLLYSFGAVQNKVLGFLGFVLLLGAIVWAVKDFRDKQNGGFIRFGQAFSLGFQTGIYAGIIGAVYSYLFFKYFDPSVVELMMTQAEEQVIRQNPNMDDAQLETAISWARKFMQPGWMTFWSLLWSIILSAVISLIIAAIMKKEENPMQESV